MYGGSYGNGNNYTQWIHRAPVANPLSWRRVVDQLNAGQLDEFVVPYGPKLAILGGWNDLHRHEAHDMAPWSPTYEGVSNQVPVRNFVFGYADGFVYTVGGVLRSGDPGASVATNKIYRTAQRLSGRAVVDPTLTGARPVILSDGQPWAQSASERAGMVAWQHHAYAPNSA
jgi:hypothetical protein